VQPDHLGGGTWTRFSWNSRGKALSELPPVKLDNTATALSRRPRAVEQAIVAAIKQLTSVA
jgi:hypothetical protein